MIPLLEWPRVWGVRMIRWRALLAFRQAQRHLEVSYRREDESRALLDEARHISRTRTALINAATRR